MYGTYGTYRGLVRQVGSSAREGEHCAIRSRKRGVEDRLLPFLPIAVATGVLMLGEVIVTVLVGAGASLQKWGIKQRKA